MKPTSVYCIYCIAPMRIIEWDTKRKTWYRLSKLRNGKWRRRRIGGAKP